MARDEHDGNLAAAGRQRLVQLEPTLPRHPDVEHEAARAGDGSAREEFCRRPKRLDAVARGTEQAFHAAPDRGVVVDDDDGRGRDHGTVLPASGSAK